MKNSMMRSPFCLALVLAMSLSLTVRSAHSSSDAGKVNESTEMHFVAVAYTQPGFKGVAWRIPETGSYDLWKGFGLPNDSIASIAVAPGYEVTLYEHSEFGGESITIYEDTPVLGVRGELADWASSLTVKPATAISEWLQRHGENVNEPFKINPDVAKVAQALEFHKATIILFQKVGESSWYGTTTDEQRIQLSGALLKIFSDCGVDVHKWEPNTFAQMMNNFYDWCKDLNVWETACLVLNVDPESFSQAAEEWKTYTDEKFGFSVEYPAGIYNKTEAPYVDKDGMSNFVAYSSTDEGDGKYAFSVSGGKKAKDVDGHSLLKEAVNMEEDAYGYVYGVEPIQGTAKSGADFYTFDYIDDSAGPGGISHVYCVIGKTGTARYGIRYPQEEAERFAEITTRMDKSLKVK